MLKSLQESRDSDGGFTLIELLIVIVILGVLAAIVVFSVAGVTSKGAASACKADIKTIDVAAEAFYAQGQNANPPTGGATTIGQLVTAKLIHADTNFTTTTGTTLTIGTIPLVFVPGSATDAGNADTTVCPLN